MTYPKYKRHRCNVNNMELVDGCDVYNHCLNALDMVNTDNPLLRFVTLIHDIGKAPAQWMGPDSEFHFNGHDKLGVELAENICDRLKMSNEEREYITTLVRDHMFSVYDSMTKKRLKKLLRKNRHIEDLLTLREADIRGNTLNKTSCEVNNTDIVDPNVDITRRLLKEIEEDSEAVTIGDLEFNGQDLIEMGYKPGPMFKKCLEYLLELVLDDDRYNDHIILKSYAEQYMEGGVDGGYESCDGSVG